MNAHQYRIFRRDPWLDHATFPDPFCNKGVRQSNHLGVDAFEPCPGGCDLGFAEPIAAPEVITAVVREIGNDEDNGHCYCCGADLKETDIDKACDCSNPCSTRKSCCQAHCGHYH